MAVRLFVGNMPYGATEADLRAHFSGAGEPSQIVIPVDRETGRPRGFAFVEFQDRAVAEAAISRFNQQPFMGRSLSVSEARPREERPAGGFAPRPPGGGFAPRPPGAGGGFGRPSGGFSGPGGGGGFRPGGPPRPGEAPGGPNRFGPPKEERLEREALGKQRARSKGTDQRALLRRMDGLYDDPNDDPTIILPKDFDDSPRNHERTRRGRRGLNRFAV